MPKNSLINSVCFAPKPSITKYDVLSTATYSNKKTLVLYKGYVLLIHNKRQLPTISLSVL